MSAIASTSGPSRLPQIVLVALSVAASVGIVFWLSSPSSPIGFGRKGSRKPVHKHTGKADAKHAESKDIACCGAKGENGCCQSDGKEAAEGSTGQAVEVLPVKILYGTLMGTSKRFAESLQKDIFALNVSGFRLSASLVNMQDVEMDILEKGGLFIFILSTWTDGQPPEAAKNFWTLVDDYAKDFRVSKNHLEKVSFAVFGLGSSEYDDNHGKAAVLLDENLRALGASGLAPVGRGDDSIDMLKQFESWKQKVIPLLCEQYVSFENRQKVEASGCGTCSSSNPTEDLKIQKSWEDMEPKDKPSRRGAKKAKAAAAELERNDTDVTLTEEDLLNELLVESDDEEEEADTKKEAAIMDLEDLGKELKRSTVIDEKPNLDREMVTPMQRKALTKEGYKIIGTHSAVKLCRWTKAQLRGRGGCYKHTFYGIQSYQCMETTPSLACANKCVFCWRHHKNPVGREWRWKIDDPHEIVEEAIEKHRRMINEFKGAPGVKPERLEEAFTVRHCALSLVGEPIMYPYINEFLKDLHERQISSFLVTNAQFPEKIIELEPVTQLYVSIDASTKETLKTIDRPLFKDFWERFTGSLKALKDKRQRTVYRLTLVKEYNMNEVSNYCELITLGEPDIIEIKGVTFCGKSDASNLTMKNVPWHVEVRDFSKAICEKLGGSYELACEHAHSCCVLLAKKKFKVNGQWHTWINYPRFHELMKRYYEEGIPFSAEDYWAPTPEWAVFGAREEGFDPIDSRYRKNRDGKLVEIEYKSSESGCG
ncbi:S-adenosyl-L-methionine-dependent tRNA 4-demethylwyosine synthase [Phlyctochytrium bullatum]|nr:S-adenosyl-L-methionine-dependent tRNA 4-demethylwyosine synthase [Phlyctochytrium bullatum]